MRISTERTRIKLFPEQFKSLVGIPQWATLLHSKEEQQEMLSRILELDTETCTKNDIQQIIGVKMSHLLLDPECSVCGERSSVLVEVDLVVPCETISICRNCLIKLNNVSE